MKIVLRQINRAAVFRNERMRVAVFAAGIVELETRAVGQPDGGNGFVVECRGEFIEALKAASPQGNQFINSNVEDTGRLTQSRLRSGEAYSIGIWKDAGLRKEKGGQSVLPASSFARQTPPGPFSSYLVPRFGGGSSRLRIRFRDAEISADGVLTNLVDDDFLGNMRAREVEEDRLVHGAVLLLEELVFNSDLSANLDMF